MAILSLAEAAEQTGTSKVDIWRAIRAGSLPAQRTDDGGFAVDAAELFRVFEPQWPEQRPAGQDSTASPEALGRPDTAATDDMAVAFAALGAELKGLLGSLAEGRANDEQRQNMAERQGADLAERNAQLAAELAAERAKAEKAIAEYATLAERLEALAQARRPWWRRLVSD